MSHHVQGTGVGSTAMVTYLDVTYGSSVALHNWVLGLPCAQYAAWNGIPIAKQSGTATVDSWAEDIKHEDTSLANGIYRAEVSGAGTLTLRFTPISSSWCGFVIAEATGLDASPYNANNYGAGTSSSETTNSIALAQDGIVYGVACEEASGTLTRSENYTSLFEDNNTAHFTIGSMYADNRSADTTLTWTIDQSIHWNAVGASYKGVGILDQEGFRFRDDDGSESGASWKADQDVGVTETTGVNVRLRVIGNTLSDYGQVVKLYKYRKQGETDYRTLQ